MKELLSIELRKILAEMDDPNIRWGQALRYDMSLGFPGNVYLAYEILFDNINTHLTEWMERLAALDKEAFEQEHGNPLGNAILVKLSKTLSMLHGKAGIAAYYAHLAQESQSSRDVTAEELVKQFEEHFSDKQIELIKDELRNLDKLCTGQ